MQARPGRARKNPRIVQSAPLVETAEEQNIPIERVVDQGGDVAGGRRNGGGNKGPVAGRVPPRIVVE